MARLEDTLTHLDINLGDACNLRCVHCPCWINEGAPRFDPEVLEAKLTEAVAYMGRECPKFDKVMLIGGEPFVHEGVVKFLQNQRLESVMISAYTNFVWPSAEIELPGNVHFLSSLDAASQNIYGQLRRTRDFVTSQEIMRRNADRLLHVDTTVSKGNIDSLDKILDITEPYGCSHWFLPIDPRVLRYADDFKKSGNGAHGTEASNALRTAKRLKTILLDDDDMQKMKSFFERRGTERTNDFDMFMGVYLAGVDHFKDDEIEYRQDLEIKKPAVGAERCAGIRRYMEISFTPDGRFIPMIHCPELWDILGEERGPAFDTFSEVMEWENDVRTRSSCRVFCGRTQFLGLDEYEETFQEVAAERVV